MEPEDFVFFPARLVRQPELNTVWLPKLRRDPRTMHLMLIHQGDAIVCRNGRMSGEELGKILRPWLLATFGERTGS